MERTARKCSKTSLGRAYGKQEIDPINSRLSPFWGLFGTRLHIHKRLALRYNRPGFIIQSLLQTAYIFLVTGRLLANCESHF